MVTEDEIIQQYGKKYAAGEYIFREGDVGEVMYIINRGKVNITKRTDEGEKILVTLSAGDFFGEMAIIDKAPRSASAIAAEETVCIVLDEELFEQQMQRNAKIVKKILKNMSARLRAMNEQLQNLTTKDYNMRVVNTLLLHVHKNGDNSALAMPLLVQQTGMEDNMPKLNEILQAMAKARVIALADNAIIVSSSGNIEKYKQYLEMKKAFGES
ncbi:MAG TPA: cyclic nucleotide-binding domain-containing protein [Candidatus Goldiibacteriota bacterium]|nr:cyclic nucleotide-binding domain-containing protein [Candidatus Goldiibacteriota bacterium]